MDKAKILVVDDEKDMADMIAMRLDYHGFQVHAVYDGSQAVSYTKKELPDLIVLDLLMPNMDGYAVSGELRGDEKTSDIPIIMLTAKNTQNDKVKALQMGIDDYVTKPFNPEELIARIEAVLRRTKTVPVLSREAQSMSAEDKKRLEFLEYLAKEKIERIEPEYNMAARNGYTYKVAADFFKTTDGSEIEQLKYLADKQVLTKEFFDKVLLCPYCFNHDINVRETNPTNHSANINVVDMVNHFSCGYVGGEGEFLQGIKYVCPKCHKELRHIGVDYDKPGKIYLDMVTGEKFTEPEIYCQCRNCKNLFDADDAVRREIPAFVVMARAAEAVKQGGFTEINLEQELMDQEINVYNLRFFRRKFSEEIERAITFKRPLSLALVSVTNFEDILYAKGEVVARGLLKRLTTACKENLWNADILARYKKNSFINLLPEADKKDMEEAVNKFKETLAPLIADGLEVEVQSVSFPKDAETEEKLLEKLVKSRAI
jgi:diguanylate cyclase (GGDEF)-like protein